MLSTRHFTVSTAGHQMKKGTVSSSQELELWVDITCVSGSAVFFRGMDRKADAGTHGGRLEALYFS